MIKTTLRSTHAKIDDQAKSMKMQHSAVVWEIATMSIHTFVCLNCLFVTTRYTLYKLDCMYQGFVRISTFKRSGRAGG